MALRLSYAMLCSPKGKYPTQYVQSLGLLNSVVVYFAILGNSIVKSLANFLLQEQTVCLCDYQVRGRANVKSSFES